MTAERKTNTHTRRARASRLAACVLACVLCAVFVMPLLFGCSKSEASPDLSAHLISTPDENPQRPIDGREASALSACGATVSDAVYRQRVKELYTTVAEAHKKPIFVADDPVKPVYDAAIAVLDRYVLNEWHDSADGEFRIVHTVHDYLVSRIDYDFELYDRYSGGESVQDSAAFDIDGVFLNGRAVCDGLSRAVAFLCAIEGIDCMRVTGTFAGVPHAWNKVNIAGKWYNVDVTADFANYTVDTESGRGKYRKQLSHGYMLLGDDCYLAFGANGGSTGAHVFEKTVEANTDYDYYADKTVTVGGNVYPLEITNQSTLNALFTDIGKQKGKIGKIEIKLAYEGKQNVNNGDVYEAEIRTAYNKLRSPDFAFTDTQRPYFRYPNGVYLFLMYF